MALATAADDRQHAADTTITARRPALTHITWIASYPKSGNTWLRVFLANYLDGGEAPVAINDLPGLSHGEMAAGLFGQIAGKPVAALDGEAVQRLRPVVHRAIAGLRRDPNLVKTHNALVSLFGVPIVTPAVTRNAVYVLRNPLDVAISYADHFGVSLDQAIAALARADNRTKTTEKLVFQFLADWSTHVKSWLQAPGLPLHTVRYEDMLEEPHETFGAAVRFLGLPLDTARLERAIRHSAFSELRAQESASGFHERSAESDAFFREGRAGQWRDKLAPAQVDAIVEAHGEVMARHGYLP